MLLAASTAGMDHHGSECVTCAYALGLRLLVWVT